MIEAVLFDLDGTLLDTAPDLVRAANRLRSRHGLDVVPAHQVRPWVSKGGRAMIQAAFPDHEPAAWDRMLPEFLALYREQIVVETRLFEGFEHTLSVLEKRGLALAIVTNKPAWLTEPVLAALGLAHRFAVVISGDTLAEKKPHPAPVLEACHRLAIAPARAVMVGDDQRDIESARAAGSHALAVSFGYAEAADQIENWGADGILDAPAELLSWLDQHAAGATPGQRAARAG